MSNFHTKIWYQRRYRFIAWCLLPLSALYWLTTYAYQWLQKKQCLYFSVPVIVVGNLTTGGTGKTPVLITLTQFLQSQGLTVGIISRGYKSSAEHAALPVLVKPGHTAAEIGDEPVLIFEKTAAPMAIHAQRSLAIEMLLAAHPKLDLILSDDGLQNASLARDLEVLVIGSQGFGNGFILPAGPLRESKKRLSTAHFCLENGKDFQFIPKSPPLLDDRVVHAVCGIGHPERFFKTLQQLNFEVIAHPFPDHHAFTPEDFIGMEDHPILMTEKDMVKCRDFALPNAHALKMEGLLPSSFLDAFLAQVRYTIASKRENLVVLHNLRKRKMNQKLLEILVSPVSKTPLIYQKEHNELWAKADKLAFPIRNGIPIMLVEEARPLSLEELDSLTLT